MKRINFNVPDKEHSNLKAMAANRGISIKFMFITAIHAWKKMEDNNGSLGKARRTQ